MSGRGWIMSDQVDLNLLRTTIKNVVHSLGGNKDNGFKLVFNTPKGEHCFHSVGGREDAVLHPTLSESAALLKIDRTDPLGKLLNDIFRQVSEPDAEPDDDASPEIDPADAAYFAAAAKGETCLDCRHFMEELDICFMGSERRPCDKFEKLPAATGKGE